MTEVETASNPVDLVPDVIIHMVERNLPLFLDDVKSLISHRLISRAWNVALQHFVGSETVTILSEENFGSFSKFISSESSGKLQESNIRSIIFNLRTYRNYMKELNEFGQLPSLFRSQLRSFKLNFEYLSATSFESVWNFLQQAELDCLENLEIEVDGISCSNSFNIPAFILPDSFSFEGIRFPSLRRLTVPLHFSRHFLIACSPLSHLSLLMHEVELGADFWDSFKSIVRSRRHNLSLEELFFVERRPDSAKFKGSFFPRHLLESNLQLKKLALGLKFDSYLPDEHKMDVREFLSQQSRTLEYLQLPNMYKCEDRPRHLVFSSDVLAFPKLIELNYDDSFRWSWSIARMASKCPLLEKISLWTPGNVEFHQIHANRYNLPAIKNVKIRDSDNSPNPCSVRIYISIFPNMHTLELQGTIRKQSTLVDILTYGKNLKGLAIKLNSCDQRDLKRYGEAYYAITCGWTVLDEVLSRERANAMKTDCFLLGQTPATCTPYYSGQLVLDDTTRFLFPPAPSIAKFHQLEYLKLEGYFTELTLWAGIKNLTQLKEFHLRTQHLIHPTTFIKLESYLVHLKTWSYTRLEETTVLDKYREIYKYFRVLPDIPNHFHVWKFCDHHVEKRVVTLPEFDCLNMDHRTLPVISEANLSSFCEFIFSGPRQVSNIKSVVLNLQSDYKKALIHFANLPEYFRSQLLSFKLIFEFETDSTPIWNFFVKAQLNSLEELEITLIKRGHQIPQFMPPLGSSSSGSIRFETNSKVFHAEILFPSLRRLKVPFHMSVFFLEACSGLTYLSLRTGPCPEEYFTVEQFVPASIQNTLELISDMPEF